jgi:ABC-type dipeptide/oligopeptide/nickel transport system permease component
MLKYIARRLILLPFLLLGISVVVFLLFQLTPGDPISARFGLRMSGMSPETINQLRQDLGLNDPLPVQYGRYVANLLRGDLGVSINTRKPVLDEIASRIPATLELAVTAMIIIIVLSIPLGIISALNRGKLIDRVLMGGALLGFSMPSFWLGIMLILLFALNLHWLPTSGRGSGLLFERFQHLILPSFTLAIGLVGFNSRIARSATLEILGQNYITTAHSKGLSPRTVMSRHMLPNTLIPVITLFALQFAGMLSGTIVIEMIFAWPGIGRLAVNSVFQRDYPVVMGTTLIFSAVYIITNLIVDVIYPIIDPRIRLS